MSNLNNTNLLPTSFEDWEQKFDRKNPVWYTDVNILNMLGKHNFTIAELQANYGWNPQCPKILSIKLENNQDVLDVLIDNDWEPKDPKVLKYKINGSYVASKLIKVSHNSYTDESILKLPAVGTKNNHTNAHVQARRNVFTDNIDILLLTNDFNVSVAEIQVIKGWNVPNHLKNNKKLQDIIKKCNDYPNNHIINNNIVAVNTKKQTKTIFHQLLYTIQTGVKIPVKKYTATKKKIAVITDKPDEYNCKTLYSKLDSIYKIKSNPLYVTNTNAKNIKNASLVILQDIIKLSKKYNVIVIDLNQEYITSIVNVLKNDIITELNITIIVHHENSQSNTYNQIAHTELVYIADPDIYIVYHESKGYDWSVTHKNNMTFQQIKTKQDYIVNGNKYNKKINIW